MYQSITNPKYYIPDMSKYWCLNCGKFVILSEGYDNTNICCPYCKNKRIQGYATLNDADKLSELGCIAIGFLKGEDC